MKEVKSPKKPLIFYYGIALLVIVLFNVIVSPLLVKARVTEVDYGTFASPATAFASIVLPVPGGPTSRTPLGIDAPTSEYFFGL